MTNLFQKTIYNISAITPMLLVFSLVWKIQKDSNKIPILLLIISSIIIFIFILSFLYGKKNLAPIGIRVNEISPYDNWVICYVITYLLPFSTLVMDEWDITIVGIIATVIIILIPYLNSAIPNPLLVVGKYHFYKVNAENGISEYVLISKRKYRNKKQIKVVSRVFEFLLLDTEE